ncbi:amino acid synthesis family protein [Siminovitchia acidinfaciens]|uniref:Amino acid synthesis family protein n=1 Tax=Siminovitchia acidinfaciens TaxID=2321395 RepID=A0A429Y7F6_9BACI|nr:amino acid synthesis family protein [Siminovitchia acidinfaciens]RST77361.1 amino acid synthesis family protein [Siminovitchia acidinfaciens]
MEIRKIYTMVEEIYSDQGQKVDTPLRKVAVVAVVKNPYAGMYQEDLSYLIEESKEIGRKISVMAVEAMGDYPVESYGKGALVGLAGEQEHGVAMLTNIFGEELRDAVGGGVAWIPSMKKKGAAGAMIDVPLAHKDALYVRSHLDGMTLTLSDAPLDDEIAIISVIANGGRPNSRLGGLLKEDIEGKDGLR